MFVSICEFIVGTVTGPIYNYFLVGIGVTSVYKDVPSALSKAWKFILFNNSEWTFEFWNLYRSTWSATSWGVSRFVRVIHIIKEIEKSLLNSSYSVNMYNVARKQLEYICMFSVRNPEILMPLWQYGQRVFLRYVYSTKRWDPIRPSSLVRTEPL